MDQHSSRMDMLMAVRSFSKDCGARYAAGVLLLALLLFTSRKRKSHMKRKRKRKRERERERESERGPAPRLAQGVVMSDPHRDRLRRLHPTRPAPDACACPARLPGPLLGVSP